MARERRKENPEGKDSRRKERRFKGDDDKDEEIFSLRDTLRDLAIAALIIAIVMSGVYVYTENWPPIVVIISSSMQHSDTESSIGVIDIGDIVMVKKVHSRSDIKTWVEGKKVGYSTYGNYGDVIIYKKNGGDETPVIHRAVVWVDVYHKDPNDPYDITFNVSSLGLTDVTSFYIPDYPNYNPDGSIAYYGLKIDLNVTIQNFRAQRIMPHGGFLTKGDNNPSIDQVSLHASSSMRFATLVEPVKLDWVVGRAVGELPWMGLMKMVTTGEIDDNDPPASNSWVMLVVTIIVILLLPVIVDFLYTVILGITGRAEKEDEDDSNGREGKGRDRGTRPDKRNRPRR